MVKGDEAIMKQWWMEWKKVYHARNWMNRNKSFLPTWHAYIGYSFDLFDDLLAGKSVEHIAVTKKLNHDFLQAWVEMGVILGHLSVAKEGKVLPSSHMSKYIARSSEYSIGALLKEMMELHIPALLHYPNMLQGDGKMSFQEDSFGATVAETSSYLEKLAYPKIEHLLHKYPISSILDIGCGHAGYLIKLAKKNPRIQLTGIEKNQDVWQQAVNNVQKENLSHIALYHADIHQWQGAPQSLDLIMLNNILYYFNQSEREFLFSKLQMLVKPQGWVSIISPLYANAQGKPFSSAFNLFMNSHENLYALPKEQEVRSLAEQYRFQIKEFRPIVREGSWYFITMKNGAMSST